MYHKKYVLNRVKESGLRIKTYKNFYNDFEVILTAVKSNGFALNYASDRLKDNKEIVLEAVKNNGMALKWVSPRLQNDKDVVLEAIKNDGWALKYASDKFKDNKELILIALKDEGLALEFVSDRLCNDEEVVLEAVKQNPKAINFASDKFKSEKEIMQKNNKKYLFEELEDRGIGYLGTLELIFDEIESYGEEIERKCCFDDNTSWVETKKIYIEYYTKNMVKSNYLWSCISQLSNKLSEALN